MLESSLIWKYWYGGLAIAFVAVLVVLVAGKYLSITRGYVSLCSIITKKPYFHRQEMGGPFGFRTMFVVGVVLGGLGAAFYNGSWQGTFELGSFSAIWGESLYTKATVLLVGGVLWGYGSRMAKGCTSGNAISGMAQGSPASFVATGGFLIGGVAITYLVNWSLL